MDPHRADGGGGGARRLAGSTVLNVKLDRRGRRSGRDVAGHCSPTPRGAGIDARFGARHRRGTRLLHDHHSASTTGSTGSTRGRAGELGRGGAPAHSSYVSTGQTRTSCWRLRPPRERTVGPDPRPRRPSALVAAVKSAGRAGRVALDHVGLDRPTEWSRAGEGSFLRPYLADSRCGCRLRARLPRRLGWIPPRCTSIPPSIDSFLRRRNATDVACGMPG
jgi:hypothetical protein